MIFQKSYLKWILMITALGFLFGGYFLSGRQHPERSAVFAGKEKSVAVVPFINSDMVVESAYLSAGITDEIVHRLKTLPGLRVVSGKSTVINGQASVSSSHIAGVFRVTSLLRGEVKKVGRTLLIHVELLDAGDGNKIWSQDFRGSIDELFSFQNEIAQAVAQQLNIEITAIEISRNKRPTQNLESYDQYLKGLYFWNKRDPKSLRKGIDYFNGSIRLDSNNARAWSGLADCYSALGYGSQDPPAVDFLQAEAAANQALALDSTLAEPHTSLGYIYFYYYWNWDNAEKEFLKAIRLNPEYPLAHDSYVYFLTAQGRFAEAAVEMEKAAALDPASPYIETDLGFSLYYAGFYDRAVVALKETMKRYPDFPLAHLWLGRCYQEKRMYDESLESYSMALKKDSTWPVALAAKGFVFAVSNQKSKAENLCAQMTELMKHRYVTPYGMALIYAGLKDRDKTFEWLNRAYADRANWLVWLKLDPRWKFIQTDRRYLSLLQKVGLDRQLPPAKLN